MFQSSIVAAAEKSLAASLLPRFKEGYQQMLGRRFDNGVELSGGEWQKVALARAYMREAQVLILDEPTAALDARAEYEVFLRFSELVAGRMAVIISHRFSTVRMADRIIVLKLGQVIEDGSHAELLAGWRFVCRAVFTASRGLSVRAPVLVSHRVTFCDVGRSKRTHLRLAESARTTPKDCGLWAMHRRAML